ncbi:Shedu immune nuclease family protein [Azohydromonas lata]|uniref:Shedu immune nuclease family protein n=1 Tax=Azohydromonas lata TaxID=45677 RepID=UPI001EE44D1A|nr:Shedu immune nuclease family protein [Azohydromonas lata]
MDDFSNPNRKVRIATKLIDQPETYAFAKIKDELILRYKSGAKTCITAKFFEDNRKIFVLSIQGYTVATDKPHNASFAFVGEEISKLVEFLNHIQAMPLTRRGSQKITDEDLRRIVLSNAQAQAIFHDNQELFAEVLRSAITKEDVIAVGYRKRQLQIFQKLLEDAAYFEEVKVKKQCKDEGVWQKFFEKNPWIFGYGLSYIYLSSLDEKKLEQVVHGHTVSEHGKRVDALLRTRGVISSLCFAEIKTHKTALLQLKAYRSGCWAPSDELAGGVSQVQGTVALATESIRNKLSLTDEVGNPTGEEAFNYTPKSFMVIGSLREFMTDKGVNQERYRSFELFRRNIASPEIITFDELYERARFIVEQHET